MPIANEKLARAFAALMERVGKPIELFTDRRDRRGPLAKIYRLQNGQTVRLRTNQKPTVMTLADSSDAEARIDFESEDFLGIAFPGQQPNTVVGYLVPAQIAAREMRDVQTRWRAQASRGETRTRVLIFNDRPNSDAVNVGYDHKWAEYYLGEISLGADNYSSRLDEVIAAARRAIAAEVRKPESAVRISIEY